MTAQRPLVLYATTAIAVAVLFAALAAVGDGEWWIVPVALAVHFVGFMAYIQFFARRLGAPAGEEPPGEPGRPGAPETAEPERAEEISRRVPETVSGKGRTPLGSTDQHSDAPGPHGLGDRPAGRAEG